MVTLSGYQLTLLLCTLLRRKFLQKFLERKDVTILETHYF